MGNLNESYIIESTKQRFEVCAKFEDEARLQYLKDLNFYGYVRRSKVMRLFHLIAYKLFPNWYIYNFGCNWQWTKD